MVEADPGLFSKYHIRPILMFWLWGLRTTTRRWRRLSDVSLRHLSACPERYLTATKRLGTIWIKTQHPIHLMSSTLILDTKINLFSPSWYGKGHGLCTGSGGSFWDCPPGCASYAVFGLCVGEDMSLQRSGSLKCITGRLLLWEFIRA